LRQRQKASLNGTVSEMTYQKLYDLTLAIKQLIDSESHEDREEQIRKLHKLLDERGDLINQLLRASTVSDRALCQKVIALNHDIDSELGSLRSTIIKDMNTFRHLKKSVNRYRNPYQGPTKDGMFLDKRE
jgi:hypothetical protein